MLYLPYCARALAENNQKAAFAVISGKECNAYHLIFRVVFDIIIKMKKHVFKITAITVALIVAFTAAFAAIFVRTCPKAVADMAKRTGNMELSLKYREKSYLKSNDYTELALLCEAAIECDDYKKTVAYAETFIASDKFIDYCGEKGGNYYGLITACYANALYKTGEKVKGVESAFSLTKSLSELNAVSFISAEAIGDKDEETINLIIERLEPSALNGKAELLSDLYAARSAK